MALEQLVTNKIPSPKQLTSLTRSFAALRKSIGIDAKNRRAVSASFLPKASVQLSQLPSPLQTASQAQKLKMHSTILSKTETPKVVWTPSNPANTEAQRRSWITSNDSFKDPINENTNHSSSLGWSRKDSTCVRWSVRQAPTSTRAGSLAETNIPYDQSGGDRKIEFSQIDHCKSSAQKPLVRRFSYLNGKRRSSQMDRHNKTFFVWPTPIPVRMKEPELPTLCPREVRRRAGLARLIQSGECLSGRIRFFCGQLDGMGQHLRVASEEEEIGWRVIARIGVAASQGKKMNFLSKEEDLEAEVESLTEDETDNEKGIEKEKKSDENQWDLQMLDQMFNEIKMSAACSIDGTNSYLSQD
ncbi:unnamed protein product [Protopolystoma xenopodis]|uniref:Uncharacterized protein n=1 Tax=Protopolystoma xenopodis TaxID=117903 RepID=A0A448XAU6_9PLAT|nr:unnamed protein product [Protopolystoma xenopodis]